METRPREALRVGLFVLLGLILTSVIIFGIESWRLFRPGYQIDLLFESASGVLKGAPVKFAGVEVGEVIDIRVERTANSTQPQVRVRIWLPTDLKLRSDDRAWIGILGLLGEKYVEILAGPGQGVGLSSGDTLDGTGVISELEFTQRISDTISKLNETLDSAEALLKSTHLPDRIILTLDNADRLSNQLEQTAQETDKLLGRLQTVSDEASKSLRQLRTWGPVYAITLIVIPVLLFLLTR